MFRRITRLRHDAASLTAALRQSQGHIDASANQTRQADGPNRTYRVLDGLVTAPARKRIRPPDRGLGAALGGEA